MRNLYLLTLLFFSFNAYTVGISQIGGFVPHGLGDHTDVTLTNPMDGEILVFNSTTGQWENTVIPLASKICDGDEDTCFEVERTADDDILRAKSNSIDYMEISDFFTDYKIKGYDSQLIERDLGNGEFLYKGIGDGTNDLDIGSWLTLSPLFQLTPIQIQGNNYSGDWWSNGSATDEKKTFSGVVEDSGGDYNIVHKLTRDRGTVKYESTQKQFDTGEATNYITDIPASGNSFSFAETKTSTILRRQQRRFTPASGVDQRYNLEIRPAARTESFINASYPVSHYFFTGHTSSVTDRNAVTGIANELFTITTDAVSSVFAGLTQGDFEVQKDKDLYLKNYPETRDDSATNAPLNFLYTKNTGGSFGEGHVLSAPLSALNETLNSVVQISHSVVGQTVGNQSTINMSTLDTPADSNYLITGGGVRVATAGLYKITYHAHGNITNSSNSRTGVNWYLSYNSVIDSKTESSTYHRLGAVGKGSTQKTVFKQLNANDLINLRATRYVGTAGVQSIFGTTLTVEKIK